MQPMNETQRVLLEYLSAALFQKQVNTDIPDPKAFCSEAYAHGIFPVVFAAAKNCFADTPFYDKAKKVTHRCISVTIRNYHAHVQLHRLLEKEEIPYVVLKGLSSALYYPHPEHRGAGDVDFLVKPEDFERCQKALSEQGFVCTLNEGKHIALKKDDVKLEQHRMINGIPNTEMGDIIKKEFFSDLIETAVLTQTDYGAVYLPDPFHHGVILLLHTSAHLSSEGIGLRQLCDWAVFESSFSDEAFRDLFEQKLKSFGLWRFAAILSLCANRFLGAPPRSWQGQAEESVLEDMVADIMQAGNFGGKDSDRKGQIKYIADRGEGTVKGRSVLRQGIKAIRKKAVLEHKSEPAVVADYVKNVLSGKRKPDTVKTLESAAERRALYSEFHLFETDN